MGTQVWRMAVAIGLGMSGAIWLSMPPAVAGSVIVPDNTLGLENSQVIPNFQGLPIEVITNGAVRGKNLFHSFQEFNVTQGRSAYFFGRDASIQNILARITGSNSSNIDGRLGTFLVVGGQFVPSNANLFLINPNGIIFGAEASLDVGGSFVATTANSVQFPNGDLFSASAPTAPSQALTVNPSALLYNAIAAQNVGIVNRSQVNEPNNLIATPTVGLQVLDGKSLLLVGGNVQLDGGIVRALGGRVEIGAVVGSGTVGFSFDSNQPRLNFPPDLLRANVLLDNQAKVNVVGSGGGDVAVYGQNISLAKGSTIISGIASGLGSLTSRSEDITIDATGAIKLSDSSQIVNGVLGLGSSGNIQISGQTVDLVNGSAIGSFSAGQGKAGNVTIQAQDTISLSGKNQNGLASGIAAAVASLLGFSGEGNGGDVLLQARTISLQDGAQVGTNNLFAKGSAGNIRVEVTDTLFMSDASALQTATSGQGNAGNIFIDAGNTVLINSGASLISSTAGQGK